LCQRYYESISAIPTYSETVTQAVTRSIPTAFNVTKRVVPTMALNSIVSNEGTTYSLSAKTNGFTAAWSCPVVGTANIYFGYTADSEL